MSTAATTTSKAAPAAAALATLASPLVALPNLPPVPSALLICCIAPGLIGMISTIAFAPLVMLEVRGRPIAVPGGTAWPKTVLAWWTGIPWAICDPAGLTEGVSGVGLGVVGLGFGSKGSKS